jgi:hypothetical protein
LSKWPWTISLKERALFGLVGLATNPKDWFEMVNLRSWLPQPNQILSANTNNIQNINEVSNYSWNIKDARTQGHLIRCKHDEAGRHIISTRQPISEHRRVCIIER